jgi:hypothetical protein
VKIAMMELVAALASLTAVAFAVLSGIYWQRSRSLAGELLSYRSSQLFRRAQPGQALFQVILNSTPVAVACHDLAGQCIFMNAAEAKRLDAFRSNQIDAPDPANNSKDVLHAQVVATGTPAKEVRPVGNPPQGEPPAWRIIRVPVANQDGIPLYVVSVALPLDAAGAEAEPSLTASAQGRIASDLTEPEPKTAPSMQEIEVALNAMTSFAEAVANEIHGPVDSQFKTQAHQVVDLGLTLFKLLKTEFSAVGYEFGAFGFQPSLLGVSATLKESVKLAAKPAASRSIKLSVQTESRLPKMFVDGPAMGQILQTTLEHVMARTSKGGEIILAAERSSDGWMEISVSGHDESGRGSSGAGDAIPGNVMPIAGPHSTDFAVSLDLARCLMLVHFANLVTDNDGAEPRVVLRFPPCCLLATGPSGVAADSDIEQVAAPDGARAAENPTENQVVRGGLPVLVTRGLASKSNLPALLQHGRGHGGGPTPRRLPAAAIGSPSPKTAKGGR